MVLLTYARPHSADGLGWFFSCFCTGFASCVEALCARLEHDGFGPAGEQVATPNRIHCAAAWCRPDHACGADGRAGDVRVHAASVRVNFSDYGVQCDSPECFIRGVFSVFSDRLACLRCADRLGVSPTLALLAATQSAVCHRDLP